MKGTPIMINRHSGQPLYRQIARHLESDLTGKYAPGDRLPTESELAQGFDVNRLTVRQALAELTRRGLVDTVRGRGSFAAVPPLRYDIAAGADASFTSTMRARGHEVETRLIKATTDSDAAVSQLLGTNVATQRTDILRLVDGQPWSLTATWLSPNRFPGLAREWNGDSSLYAVLAAKYGVRMKRASRSFAALTADATDAEWLLVPVASPILQVRGVNTDEAGTAIAVVEHHYRGDRLQFTVDHL